MIETREHFVERKQREYERLQVAAERGEGPTFSDVALFIGEAYGSATWAPVRPPGFDSLAWGVWEAWEHLEITELDAEAHTERVRHRAALLESGAIDANEHQRLSDADPPRIGARPTGDWIAWNSCTGGHLGFPGENARKKAEMFCVLQNNNAPTRVCPFGAESETSKLDFDVINDQVNAEIERIEAATKAAH